MISFLRNHKLYLVLSIIYVLLVLSLTIRIDYSLMGPGKIDNVNTLIDVDNSFNSEGSINSTSIIAIDRITIFQYLLYSKSEYISIEKIENVDDILSDLDNLKIGKNRMASSIDASVINVSNYLDLDIEYTKEYYIYITSDSISNNNLSVDDRVISINGNTDIISEAKNDVCNELAVFKVEKPSGDIVYYDILKQNINGNCVFGVVFNYEYDITSTEIDYDISFTNTYGSSGGLMQSLYLYNSLTEYDITNGLKVAGTGTINDLGDVGYIGGIEQKIYTAYLNDVDIFIVPHLSDDDNDDYFIAQSVADKLGTDMLIVGVSTFDETVIYLKNISR